MGRGRGGSTSHGKRTPGGIRTSSKMSKVGEIEAKHGVLGEDGVGNDADIGNDYNTSQSELELGASPVRTRIGGTSKMTQTTEPSSDEGATPEKRSLSNEFSGEGLRRKMSNLLQLERRGRPISDGEWDKIVNRTKQIDPTITAELESNDISTQTAEKLMETFYEQTGSHLKARASRDLKSARNLAEMFRYTKELIAKGTNEKEASTYTPKEFVTALNEYASKNPKVEGFLDPTLKTDQMPLLPAALEKPLIKDLANSRIRASNGKVVSDSDVQTKAMAQTAKARARAQAHAAAQQYQETMKKQAESRLARFEKIRQQELSNFKSNAIKSDFKGKDSDGYARDNDAYASWLLSEAKANANKQNALMTDGYHASIAKARIAGLKDGEAIDGITPGWRVVNNKGNLEVHADLKIRVELKKHGIKARESNPPARVVVQHIRDANTGEYLMDHSYVELTDVIKKKLEDAIDNGHVLKGSYINQKYVNGIPKPDQLDDQPMIEMTVPARIYSYANGKKTSFKLEGQPLPETYIDENGRVAMYHMKDGKTGSFEWDPKERDGAGKVKKDKDGNDIINPAYLDAAGNIVEEYLKMGPPRQGEDKESPIF